MKYILLVLFSFAPFGVNACSRVDNTPSTVISRELVKKSDAVVWVEYLSSKEVNTWTAEELKDDLAKLLNSISGCSNSTTTLYKFGELSSFFGETESLIFRYMGYSKFLKFANRNMLQGNKYVMFVSDGSIVGVINANDPSEIESMKSLVYEYRK